MIDFLPINSGGYTLFKLPEETKSFTWFQTSFQLLWWDKFPPYSILTSFSVATERYFQSYCTILSSQETQKTLQGWGAFVFSAWGSVNAELHFSSIIFKHFKTSLLWFRVPSLQSSKSPLVSPTECFMTAFYMKSYQTTAPWFIKKCWHLYII